MTDQKRNLSLKTAVQLVVFILILPLSPVLITRRWAWWEAWAYAGAYILGFAVSRALAARRHPDLLAERARMMDHGDAPPWDRVLAPLVGLGGGLIPVASGMDALWGWSSDFSLGWKLGALAVILLGYVISSWALIVNRYFSGMARIQHDRDHRVVSRGPYSQVRHPGYAGALLTYLASPVLLDSGWAFLPAVSLGVILVIRTRLEDRMLQEQLEGYRAYADRVQARLVPGLW